MLSPRLRLMVGGGSLDPRRGRLRANVSGSASILGRRLRVLSLMHLPWPHGASGRPSWAIALTCGSVLNIHVPMTHTTSRMVSRRDSGSHKVQHYLLAISQKIEVVFKIKRGTSGF